MIHVRELPPLRLHVEIITPNGRRVRWGPDEPNPANIPTGLSFSSTMPGGYEQLDVTLARKAGTDYSDLDRLSTIRVRGAGGAIAWEGRLERTPRVSGDQLAISPSAVGWQAHLDDDKSAREVYADAGLSGWGAPALSRTELLGTAFAAVGGVEVRPGTDDSVLVLSQDRIVSSAGTKYLTEAWYSAGVPIGAIFQSGYTYDLNASGGPLGGSWVANLTVTDTEDDSTSGHDSRSVVGGSSSGYLTTTATTRKFALLQMFFNAATTADGQWEVRQSLVVYGAHGLTRRGPDPGGFYASDVVTHAVGQWAPLLVIDGTVQASSFIIPHLTFPDATTAGEIVRQATAFGLQDWAVWDNRTFYWAQRGTYGRKWRARIAPAQLSETGPQLDRLWESVVVSYTDVGGTTRTVGPPGSGADTEDAVLHDTDPENPANQLGIIRRDLLSMGTSTAAGAIELGRRFLEEQKLLDTSGQAQLVGHVMDDRGVLHPYWRVRAGDTISFIDAADTSERRIVRASHDHDSRTCTVDLDAPPEGLDALLARLGVVLVPLGVGS